MNPILLDLGFIEIRWYSVFILLAFIIGYLLVISRCKKKGISTTIISDMCFYLVIVCILGARIYYCLFELEDYKNIIDIFKIWKGGLAIHGGVIAGIIFIYFYTKKKNLKLLDILDIFAPALILGQAIGRWGNFFNQEAFGPETTLSTLKNLYLPKFIIDGMYIDGKYINGQWFQPGYYHPTFLYESLGCIIIFIIMMTIRNLKKIKTGQIAGIYFIGYGILRFLIECLRQDPLRFLGLKVAQIVSIIMILVGIFLIIKPYIKGLKKIS
ncbi:MAG: prolipoprotein diacylglyceryl transferase [Bacilli bacterium]|nr:prolipoprotein diacylglyceryl transferase [Bacilli bacterium]